MTYPILYSFRRCPYAMRARSAIAISGLQVDLREVALKDKPAALLTASPKGTVPVLITPNHDIIDESLDIMSWALSQSDPQHWLPLQEQQAAAKRLIDRNDGDFKYYLDRYKYADRYPEQSERDYREQGEKTLLELEHILQQQPYLLGNRLSSVDIAILPFIRQFASVDKAWFEQAPYPSIRAWLTQFLNSTLFQQIMVKRPTWQENDAVYLFPNA